MVAAFPIACLTPTDTVPTRVYLTTIQTEINSNAISIASVISPTYGHLVLTVIPSTYASYGANAFTSPVNPGLNPTYEATATSDTIRETNHRHIICRVHYETYHIADKVLRKILLDAVPEIYLEAIKYNTLGFGRCTALDILDHLWDTYGVIDDNQLSVNLEVIKNPWQPPPPPSRNSSPS